MLTQAQKEQQRQYRVNAHLRWCECGQRAVKRSAGSFICERCWRLQEQYRHTNIVDRRLEIRRPRTED